MTYISGSSLYGSLDILSGFGFLPIEEELQRYFTMVTLTSVWRMQGAPMGWSNTPALYGNQTITEIVKPSDLFAKQRNGAAMWLDDILFYTTCFGELLRMKNH